MSSRRENFRNHSPVHSRIARSLSRGHEDRFYNRQERRHSRSREESRRNALLAEEHEAQMRDRGRSRSREDHRYLARGRRSRSIDRGNPGRRFEGKDDHFSDPYNKEQRSLSRERRFNRRSSSMEKPHFSRHWNKNRSTFFSHKQSKFNNAEVYHEAQDHDENYVLPPAEDWDNAIPRQSGSDPSIYQNYGTNQNFNQFQESTQINQEYMQGTSQAVTNTKENTLAQEFTYETLREIPNQDTNEESVPEFNPETSKITSRDWIKLIDDIGRKRNWKKDEKLYIMTSRLAGFARQWYLTIGVNFKTWGELKSAFFKVFPTELDYYALLEKMMSRIKEENESLITYFHHKVALLNDCDIHGKKAVSCIIGGLTKQKIRNQARAQKCEDPDGLYAYLRSLVEKPTPNNKEANQMESKKAKLVCYFCHEHGHFLKNCPNMKMHKCTVCFRFGHDCTLLENNNVMLGGLSRKPVFAKYFSEVVINSSTLKAYIDLTSDCCTIREETVFDLKLPMKKSYKTIRGFGSSLISSTGFVDVIVSLDRTSTNIRMSVIPNDTQAIPVVVGRSLLERSHIKFVKFDDKIRVFQTGEDTGENTFAY